MADETNPAPVADEAPAETKPKAKPKDTRPLYPVLKDLQWGTHRAKAGTKRRDIPVGSIPWLLEDGSIGPAIEGDDEGDSDPPEAEADHAGSN